MIQLKQLFDTLRLVRPGAPATPARQEPAAPAARMGADVRVALDARAVPELANAAQGVGARVRALNSQLKSLVSQEAAANDAATQQVLRLQIERVRNDIGGLTKIQGQLTKLAQRQDLTPAQVARAAQVAAEAAATPDLSTAPRLEMALRVIGAGDRADQRLVNATAMLDQRLAGLTDEARKLVHEASRTNDATTLQKIQIKLADLDRTTTELKELRNTVANQAVRGGLTEQQSGEIANLAAQAAQSRDVAELPRLTMRARVVAAGEPTNWQLVNATARLDHSLGQLRNEASKLAAEANATNDAFTLQKIQIKLMDLNREIELRDGMRDQVAALALRRGVPAQLSRQVAVLADQAANARDVVELHRIAIEVERLVAAR